MANAPPFSPEQAISPTSTRRFAAVPNHHSKRGARERSERPAGPEAIMSREQQALERSVLERKERDELHTIAEALGVKPGTRTKKADLIQTILVAAGVEPAPEGAGEGKPKRTRAPRAARTVADPDPTGAVAEEPGEPATEDLADAIGVDEAIEQAGDGDRPGEETAGGGETPGDDETPDGDETADGDEAADGDDAGPARGQRPSGPSDGGVRGAANGQAPASSGGGGGNGGLLAAGAQLLGALLGAPGRATGGPVAPGRPYLVGERGPELFVPTASGRVETGRGAVREIRMSINVTAPAGEAPQALARSGRQVARAVKQALMRVED
ncbi:MAG TPA: hypothetical protein VM933_10410 [Acidimicrobiales bacterium]|nr:hypothetical protein [Acidimicrobiales bacterium]